jgi:hypothetical protein
MPGNVAKASGLRIDKITSRLLALPSLDKNFAAASPHMETARKIDFRGPSYGIQQRSDALHYFVSDIRYLLLLKPFLDCPSLQSDRKKAQLLQAQLCLGCEVGRDESFEHALVFCDQMGRSPDAPPNSAAEIFFE